MPFYGPSLPHSAALSDLLAPGLAAKPDEIALISGNRRWTWRELQRDIDALASGLTTLGLNRGDRIASLMPNQGELLLFYLACHKAGLIVTPLNYRYTPPEIDYALGLSGAAALCVGAERSADVEASALARTLPKGLICFGGPIGDAPRFEDLVASGTPTANFPTPDIDDPALIFFTSGSTGKPKGVTHSYSSFGCMAASFAGALDLSQDDIVLPGGSIAHIGSLSTAFAAFFAGATVVIPHSFDAATILSALRQHRPTILLMIPAAFVAMERDPDTTHEDFSSLRICVTGGDKFPANVAKEFADKTGVLIQETYGLTEGADCLFNQSHEFSTAGSVGTVGPGYVASLRDEDGNEVPPDTDGNFWLSGAPVMTGYWQNKEATDAVFDGEWFDTGDVMRVDAEGRFWFRGRKKQIIVHDGSNIVPQEIEEAVMAHPAVDLAGVIGVRDEVHGENVWAYVTLKQGAPTPDVHDIIDTAKQRVGYKAPEMIVILDEMPLNPTGKIDRVGLKKLAEAHHQSH